MDLTKLEIIKKVIPTICPECGKEIFMGYQFMGPSLTTTTTKAQMEEAKAEIKKRLDEIKFKDKKAKAKWIKWVDEENTLIDHTDVEEFLRQIVLEQSPELPKTPEPEKK